MTLDNINMTGITKGSYTGNDMFCKSQLITCRFVKNCNGVCPFEDALKHADQTADEQNVIDHDRDWIIGCLEHDGFIHTHRFDKANRIILEALQTDVVRCKDCRHAVECNKSVQYTRNEPNSVTIGYTKIDFCSHGERKDESEVDE